MLFYFIHKTGANALSCYNYEENNSGGSKNSTEVGSEDCSLLERRCVSVQYSSKIFETEGFY